jgi:hypothetical protein
MEQRCHPGRFFKVFVLAGMIGGVFMWPLPLFCAEAHNVRLLGHNDLQGRDSLQIVLKGNFAYIGHHRGQGFNPLTGKNEANGTSIVDVSDPRQPKVVVHIPGRSGAESRAVQVAHNYFDGKDYLLRNQESGEFIGFEVWDISDRVKPRMVSTISHLQAAHKSWWDAETGYAYLSGTQAGWRGQHLIIYDLRSPSQPKFVSNWGLPQQRPGRSGGDEVSLHHPVIDGNRAYLSYLFGGDMVILDITDKSKPGMISHLDFSPPFSGIHTTAPFNGMKVPDYTKGQGEVRNFLVLSEESFAYHCQELRRQMYIVDATEETNPIPVAIFKVPEGDFCKRGGRFGPHQFAETKDGEIIGGTLLYVAYFNAGLRIVDIADPYHPREVGSYIPDPVASGPGRGKRFIQTNDVDLDYRGLICITDRSGNGLHILELTKKE